ncbi:isocitrate lyase/PEP mutase family protein [Agromyces allii]|uniref:Isocitrate lyase/phosphoenolpyruvate mutase family protein n=1 Tax=Agromyces allii TaxID=393607 RepID=A0ABN2RB40_9MICO|nr:isocitrate lyase/phosphoenolpyruvate mutase family protein [Agromyces allii]
MITPAEFAARHRPGAPLLLPNAWDAASGRWLASRGHDAIGTTSLGVALANGLHDGAGETADETMRLAELLTAAGIGLSVDLESGFSDDPDEVGDYVGHLSTLGVLGVNIEDSTAAGALADPELAAAKVAAIAAAAPGLFVNARTDAFWIEAGGPMSEREAAAVARAQRYLDAGATGVFVPGAMPIELVARLASTIDAPLNVLPQADAAFEQLAAAGVARVSTGPLLFRAALGAMDDALARTLGAARAPSGIPTYDEAVEFAGPSSTAES